MMLRALQIVWMSPATILVWIFYILPFWALGYLRYVRPIEAHPIALFEAVFRDAWYSRLWNYLWRGWGGHCVPHAIVSKQIYHPRHIAHEIGHHLQHMVLGPLFIEVYLFLLFVYGYRDHPLEAQANKFADKMCGKP